MVLLSVANCYSVSPQEKLALICPERDMGFGSILKGAIRNAMYKSLRAEQKREKEARTPLAVKLKPISRPPINPMLAPMRPYRQNQVICNRCHYYHETSCPMMFSKYDD